VYAGGVYAGGGVVTKLPPYPSDFRRAFKESAAFLEVKSPQKTLVREPTSWLLHVIPLAAKFLTALSAEMALSKPPTCTLNRSLAHAWCGNKSNPARINNDNIIALTKSPIMILFAPPHK
jgi:hypothetical protein